MNMKKRVALALSAVFVLSAGAVASAGTPTYDRYTIRGEYVTNVKKNTTLSILHSYMSYNLPYDNSNYTASLSKICDANGNLLYSSSYTTNGSLKVKTGMKLVYDNGFTYEISIPGDVNGDGAVDINDVATATKHTGGHIQLTGAAFLAADLDKDGILREDDISLIAKEMNK
ncbi:MAG: hypothetical protein HFE86_05235 [Clostridiales bacterium]|nr:hypothetical protein [Clostridiales bacterium]